MPSIERGPRPEEKEDELKEEDPVARYKKMREGTGLDEAKLSREEAESGAVRQGKRTLGKEKREE